MTKTIARPLAVLSRSPLVWLVLLAGCTLLDQRSFDRSAGRTPIPPALAASPKGPAPIPPLYVVLAGADDDRWQTGLRGAAQEALRRKPNVLFTVQSTVPVSGSPAEQAAALQREVDEIGRQVAEALVADGAQSAQIQMIAVSDASVTTRQVRVFVR